MSTDATKSGPTRPTGLTGPTCLTGRTRKGLLCILWACVVNLLSAAPGGPTPTTEPAAEAPRTPRLVGTVIFPPRGDLQRTSSALELFAVKVPAKSGDNAGRPKEGHLVPSDRTPGMPSPDYATVDAPAMTAKALDFIRRSQQADGAWGDTMWPQSVGVTALCCLALFAEGNLPRVGPSGRALARGLEFLLEHAKDDGQIVARDVYRYGPMYDHSWATLCLLQAYGNMPWRRDMREKITRALQVFIRYQKPDGGWRYRMMREGTSDILVTVNVLYALRLGIRAGFAVPAETIDRAMQFVQARALKVDGRYTGEWQYVARGDAGSPTVSACGAIALFMTAADTRDFSDPRIRATVDYLDFYHQRYSVQDLLATPYLHYGAFYVSQAMYVSGDQYWQRYYRKMLEVFAASQGTEGQFTDHLGNSVYPTAAAAIVLQAPLGYLPLYLR